MVIMSTYRSCNSMGYMGSPQIRQVFAAGLLVYLCLFDFQCKGADLLKAAPKGDRLLLRDWVNNDPLPLHLKEAAMLAAAAAAAVAAPAAAGTAEPPVGAAVDVSQRGPHSFGQELLQHNATRSLLASLESAAKAGARDWGTVSLVPSSRGASIPSTYLGISHEWTNVEELNHGGTYQRLLEDLTAYGGGPLVLRVGGGSTDKQYQPPSQTVFDSLKTLHDETGMLFIFGINWKHRDITLARNQMEAIKANMPTGSVLSIELGNEPNFYDWVDGKPNRHWMSCCFVNDWAAFARQLSCPGNFSTCVHHQLAGPAWGHVNMRPRTMDWYLKFNNFWLNLVTVHWYQATRETSSTVENLLDEEPLRAEMKNLRQLVEISSRYNLPLRVAEMNSISNSGRQGVSNSLAAALWTLDGAFEVAATGAVGINLHWGDGLSLYAALLRQSSGSSIVKPPYYAYLMFQMALGQGVSFIANPVVKAGSNPLVKVWPLVDNKSGAVRIVLINKHKSKSGGVAIRLVAAAGEQYADGKVVRMLGKKGLADQWGVSLGGMTYKIGGAVKGTPAGEVVKGQAESKTDRERSGTVWKYPVRLPAGSAALLVIPRK